MSKVFCNLNLVWDDGYDLDLLSDDDLAFIENDRICNKDIQ